MFWQLFIKKIIEQEAGGLILFRSFLYAVWQQVEPKKKKNDWSEIRRHIGISAAVSPHKQKIRANITFKTVDNLKNKNEGDNAAATHE